jgi:hypothetical protein
VINLQKLQFSAVERPARRIWNASIAGTVILLFVTVVVVQSGDFSAAHWPTVSFIGLALATLLSIAAFMAGNWLSKHHEEAEFFICLSVIGMNSLTFYLLIVPFLKR